MLNYKMMTPQAKNFNKENPLSEYPRPYMVRDSYLNLNGIWNYEITTSPKLPASFSGKIVVPYPIESELSGVRCDLKKNEYLCYNRKVVIPKDFIKEVVLLNFGAVNQVCDIYWNGNLVMHHEGGYLPFNVNVTLFVHEGENDLSLVVKNKPDLNFWVGKAGKKRGGMWYTKTTGIWQTVWMESCSNDAIKRVIFSPNAKEKVVRGKIFSNGEKFKIYISFKGKHLLEANVGKTFELKLDEIHLWDLEKPNLYDVVVENDFRDKKVLVFKYKSKKDYHRLIGHRQEYTNVRVKNIIG